MPSDEASERSRDAAGRSVSRIVGLTAWLVGFVGVALAGRALTPWPENFPVTRKLEWLAAHPGEVDTLYLGKSHVFRSFIPPLIDARLAKLGRPTRSFNMGAEGMSDCEVDHVLRTALEIEGLHLGTVFIEAPDWIWRSFADESMGTNRSMNWHTPRQAWRMLRRLVYQDEDWKGRLELAWAHLENVWLRATSFGQGLRIVGRLLGNEEPQSLTLEDIDRWRGFQAMEDVKTEEMKERRRRFVSRAATGLPTRIAKVIRENAIPYDLEHYNYAALETQIALVRAAGAEPVYIVPPGMHSSTCAFALRDAGHVPVLLSFNDPVLYEDLYQLQNRFDVHLNTSGARLFGRIFADAVAGLD